MAGGRNAQPITDKPMSSERGMSRNRYRIEEDHHKAAYEYWLRTRSFEQTANEAGASWQTIRRWSIWFRWAERAAAHAEAEEKAIQRTSLATLEKKIQEQDAAAQEILEAGLAYIRTNGVDNSRDALAAVKIGIELQRKTMNIPDYVIEVINSNDEELIQRARELTQEIAAARDRAADDRAGVGSEGEDIIDGDWSDGSDGGSNAGGESLPALPGRHGSVHNRGATDSSLVQTAGDSPECGVEPEDVGC